jgi:hypothetical protein
MRQKLESQTRTQIGCSQGDEREKRSMKIWLINGTRGKQPRKVNVPKSNRGQKR